MQMYDFKNTKSIIWDWNGTLLNDVEISILSMNQMLEKRNIPLLNVEKYQNIFTFPVQDYYVKAGVNFDKHEWDTVAMEFINNYRKNIVGAQLHADATNILEYFKTRHIRQFILSAMEQDFLEETIGNFGIDAMFERIVGLNNHYAATKEENARRLIADINVNKNEICMIGDTIHDFEVAQSAGVACILISRGHQSHVRLKSTGALVIGNFGELKRVFP